MSSRVFLNVEDDRVERRDRKDNATRTGTGADGCLLGYSLGNLDDTHGALPAPQCGG